MAERVVLQMTVEPETRRELIAITHDILRETRAYPGCTYAAVWIPQDDDGALWTVLGWETREHFHAYTAWRRETGSMERLRPFLRGPPKIVWIRQAVEE
ncbi:MAG: antibiotic biosynthesis monooxygenase [Myxococcota bacterium]